MSSVVSNAPSIMQHGTARAYRGVASSDRLITRTTLPQVLQGLQSRGGAPALTWYEADQPALALSYEALSSQIRAMAFWLSQELGVQSGDRVVVLSGNCPETFTAHLALMSLGAITVPVSNQESLRVLQLIVDKVQARLVVTGRDVSQELAEVEVCKKQALPVMPLLAEEVPANFVWPAETVLPDDPAVILFTSGTTSAPKGVCLSHYNLLVNAEGLCRVHALSVHHVHMCILPLFHANAFGFSMVASLYAGNHVVLCAGFPGASLWTILREQHVNVVSLVPEIIRVLCHLPFEHGALPDLKYVVSAAAPLPKVVALEFMSKTGIAIHQGYGLSECVNFAATIPWDVSESNMQRAVTAWPVPSIGPALFGCELAIRRADGSLAAAEEEGEIVVSGHTVMLGYWGAEEATQAALGNGALRTGDLGFFSVINGEHYFFVTGRMKEIIIRYGENLSPLSIEAELNELRNIGRFAVTGFANEAAGEEIGLYLLAAQTPVHEQQAMEIISRCPERYRPRVILFGQTSIPATPTGKVKRSLLAQRFQPYAKRSFGSQPIVGMAEI